MHSVQADRLGRCVYFIGTMSYNFCCQKLNFSKIRSKRRDGIFPRRGAFPTKYGERQLHLVVRQGRDTKKPVVLRW
nr:MAG TPA: hypothetical protein [Caudoviricetes sp.]